MTRGETMRRVRAQAQLVRRLNERMKEETADGVKSPKMDGLPRGRGYAGNGLEHRYEKREAMRELMNGESARLREYEQTAREQMDRMRPELYAFCALYYLAGMSMEETGEAIDRSERQCARYKQEVEREDGRKMA